jgi:thioesterase domain-containing protein
LGQAFAPQPGSRVLQFASPSFDACTWEWTMALCHGATLVLADRDALMPGVALARTLRDQAITHATLPPVALSAMAVDGDGADTLPALQTLIVAGETCPPALARSWSTGRRFFNAYGPTETTVCATVHEVRPDMVDAARPVPIGRALPYARLHVLDAQGRPQPVGVAGELHIGGQALARGYLNQPALSAERFVPDPFAGTGQRMYRSGDWARWRADGELEFLGRHDDQVKLRGLRIELDEITSVLNQQAGVREATVLLQGQGADAALWAFVCAASAATHMGSEAPSAFTARLLAAMRQALPAHMLPSRLTVVQAWPLTPNGKVDKAALLALAAHAHLEAAQSAINEDQAPRSPLEQALCLLWQEALALPGACGRDTNFFEQGGHSLSAARLMSRVQTMGLDLPLATVFTHPTPAAMAAHAAQTGADIVFQAQPGATATTGPVHTMLLRQGDARAALPPLWLLHDLGGTVMSWLPLARSLAGGRGVMGLCLGDACTADELARMGSLQALAAAHVQVLRAAQPQGPYHLAGWSAGGLLAQEVAVQLRDQGEPVAYVGLLDAPWPDTATGMHAAATSATEREALLAWIAQSAMTAPPSTDQAEQGRVAALSTQLHRWSDPARTPDIDQLLTELQASPWWPRGWTPAALRHLAARGAQMAQLVQGHAVRNGDLALHYIAAISDAQADSQGTTQRDAGGKPPLRAWQHHWQATWRRPLHTASLPADHAQMLAPAHATALADLIDAGLSAASGEASPWVVIQAGRPGVTPWLCVPGAGASVTCFVPLAQALGAEVPVYGLQPRGLDRDEAPFATIEAAAAAFLQACHRQGLRGPVHLLGHSFGGWIACEMARRMADQGWAPASLNLVDSAAPSLLGPRQKPVRQLDALMALHGLLAQQCGHDLGLSRDLLATLGDDERIARLQQGMRSAGLLGPGQPEAQRAQLRRLMQVFELNLNTGYEPAHPIDVPTRLVRAADESGADETRGVAAWSAWLGLTQDAAVSGNHMTLLQRPHVQGLAQALLTPITGAGSALNEAILSLHRPSTDTA